MSWPKIRYFGLESVRKFFKKLLFNSERAKGHWQRLATIQIKKKDEKSPFPCTWQKKVWKVCGYLKANQEITFKTSSPKRQLSKIPLPQRPWIFVVGITLTEICGLVLPVHARVNREAAFSVHYVPQLLCESVYLSSYPNGSFICIFGAWDHGIKRSKNT